MSAAAAAALLLLLLAHYSEIKSRNVM